jgi:MFS family permease
LNSATNVHRGALLSVLFFGVLMAALDIAMLGPAKPAIQETYGVGEREGLWILNTFVLFNLMGVPVMSKMGDLYGRRRVFLVVVLSFGLGSVLVAASTSYAMLLVGRAVQGLSVSGIFPVAAAVVGDAFEPSERGRALGVLGAVFGVAFIVGPVVAGVLLPYGWRYIYFAYLPLVLFVWTAAYRTIPRTARERTDPLDLAGVMTLSVGLLALVYAISQLDPASITTSLASPAVWPALLAAAILLPLFGRIERRAADPVIRLTLFRNRQIALSSVIAVGAGIVEAAFIYFPTVAGLAMGVSRSAAAFMLVPLSLAIAVGSPLAGRVLDRVGSKVVVLMSGAMLVFGMTGVAAWPGSQAAFYVSTVLVGLGMAGIMGSALSYILMHEARREERTTSQGLITLFISIGQLIGAAIVGAVVASMDGDVRGFSAAFLGIAGLMFIVLLLSLRLKSRAAESAELFSRSAPS